jgi:Uma2 family endonuclease
MSAALDLNEDLLYPESDGKPMAESTEQYRWIVMIKENLEIQFADRPDVFIAADLFWYPVKVNAFPVPQQVPDVMVVFGRPKGMRRSYQQWKENNLPAQVVFEILSASNKTREGLEAMEFKFQFYEQYEVEEYYIYDPDEFTLEGWQRQGQILVPIPQMNGWVSPRLGVRFQWQPRTELVLYRPDGQSFLSSVELEQRAKQARLRADQEHLRAEQERLRAEQAQQQAEQAQQQADQERLRAEQAQQQADQERLRAEQTQQNLREAVPRLLRLGLSVEQVATSLELAIATVQSIADETGG